MMDAIIGLVTAAGVVFAAWLFGQRKGKQAERDRQAKETVRQFNDAIERAKNADVSSGNPDDDLEWLGSRGGR